MAINYQSYSGKGRPRKVDYIGGVEETKEQFADLSKLAQPDVARALTQIGTLVTNRAQDILEEKGHVQTGNLKGSITAYVMLNVQDTTAFIGSFPPGDQGFIGSDAPYANIVEDLGDGGFLVPAFEENKDRMEKMLGDAIKVTIEVVKRKAKILK